MVIYGRSDGGGFWGPPHGVSGIFNVFFKVAWVMISRHFMVKSITKMQRTSWLVMVSVAAR